VKVDAKLTHLKVWANKAVLLYVSLNVENILRAEFSGAVIRAFSLFSLVAVWLRLKQCGAYYTAHYYCFELRKSICWLPCKKLKSSNLLYASFPGRPNGGAIWGHCPPALWKGGNGGTAALTYQYRKYSNFMISEDQFEANILQLFAHT